MIDKVPIGVRGGPLSSPLSIVEIAIKGEFNVVPVNIIMAALSVVAVKLVFLLFARNSTAQAQFDERVVRLVNQSDSQSVSHLVF